MRTFSLLAALLVLGACAGPLPTPSPDKAWVDLWASGADLLMSHKLDGKQTADGRYFEVSPGAHTLEVRYRFDAMIGPAMSFSEPREVTCYLRVRYDGFAAGQRYRLETQSLQLRAQGWLFDEQRQKVARAEVDRCGSF